MVNLSLHLGATYDELMLAGQDPDRLLVVEVNPNLPRTCSLPPDYTNTLPLDLIDVVVEADGAPYALPADRRPTRSTRPSPSVAWLASSPTEPPCRSASGRCPTWWPPAWPPGRAASYGIHSEMFTDGLMRLHLAGKVTNDRKGVFDGVSVTTFALGSAELYRWLDGNHRGGVRAGRRWSTTRRSSPATTPSSPSTAP